MRTYMCTDGRMYRNTYYCTQYILYIQYILIRSVLSYSITYQSVPCWFWCAVSETLLSHYQLTQPKQVQNVASAPRKPYLVVHFTTTGGAEWELPWIILYAGSYTTSVNRPSFFSFRSASFANVPCSVANCHGSVWGKLMSNLVNGKTNWRKLLTFCVDSGPVSS